MKNTTEYTYTFATGETIALTSEQITEEWVHILKGLDKEERNNYQKETRRHCPLSSCDPDEYYLASMWDGFEDVLMQEFWDELKSYLSRQEIRVAQRHLIEGFEIEEVAEQCGLSLGHTYAVIRSIRKKLKKFC